jgi:hypothetical protein
VRLRGWLIAGLAVLMLPSCVGSCALHDNLLDARFQQVARGMPRNEVINVLGAPHTHPRLHGIRAIQAVEAARLRGNLPLPLMGSADPAGDVGRMVRRQRGRDRQVPLCLVVAECRPTGRRQSCLSTR